MYCAAAVRFVLKTKGMYFVQAAAAELRADEGEGVQHVSEL